MRVGLLSFIFNGLVSGFHVNWECRDFVHNKVLISYRPNVKSFQFPIAFNSLVFYRAKSSLSVKVMMTDKTGMNFVITDS